MNESFRCKVVLVTGAGSGIGRATALHFAREGARLVLCDINAEALAAVEAEVRAISEVVYAAVVDVADADAMQKVADAVHERVEALDILVNNAGVALAGSFTKTSLDDFRWIVGVNLWGVLHGVHVFLPAMLKRGHGHIVNMASALGYFAAPGLSGYVTTKFAVIGLSESLRAELAPRGIGVSVICPGVIATPIVGATRFRTAKPEETHSKVADTYKKNGHSPDLVARAVLDAVRHNRGTVPVSPEAWALWYLKRLIPTTDGRVGRWLLKQVAKGEETRRERDEM